MPATSTATSPQSSTSTPRNTDAAYRATLHYAQIIGSDKGIEPALVNLVSDLHSLVNEYGMDLAELVEETAPK